MIHVMATIYFKPQHLNAVKKAMLELAKKSRAEAGCLRYDLFQREDEPILVTQETWIDSSAEKAHLSGEHIANALKEIGDFLNQAPEIHYYTHWI